MDDKDCVAVFNDQDPAGTGGTKHQGVIQKLRGPLSQLRVDVIRQAFGQLPLNNSAAVDASAVHAKYQAEMHPDVRAGIISDEEAVDEFCDTFELDTEDHAVTEKGFTNYYLNVSAMIDDDDDFADLLRSCWGLSAKDPPPMSFKQKADGSYVAAPAAAQHHGNVIAWKHEAGMLENIAAEKSMKRTGAGSARTQKSSFALSHDAQGATAAEKPLMGKGGKKRIPNNTGNLVRMSLRVDANDLPPTIPQSPKQQPQDDDGDMVAGSAGRTRHPQGVSENKTLSPYAMRNLGTESPFGQDSYASSPSPSKSSRSSGNAASFRETSSPSKRGGSANLMSLRDHMDSPTTSSSPSKFRSSPKPKSLRDQLSPKSKSLRDQISPKSKSLRGQVTSSPKTKSLRDQVGL
jgi:hypothetical protein